MDDGAEQKQSAAARFDEQATAYLDSRVHRSGDDLDQLAEWVGDAERALDIATGAGHTAGALSDAGVETVVATDAAPEMVTTAKREFPTLAGVVCDAERLPFAADSFDAVTCRIAAHHFPSAAAFVEEVARVLEPGGTLVFEDNVVPDDGALDDFLNRVETTRDRTHVRSHRVDDWLGWVAYAGLTVEASRIVKKPSSTTSGSRTSTRRLSAVSASRRPSPTDRPVRLKPSRYRNQGERSSRSPTSNS